jgi:uncharacterized protein YcaQ
LVLACGREAGLGALAARRSGALADAIRPGRLGSPPLRAFLGLGYRFEAYTPAAKRKLGYYALPLLWHDRVIGWANASVAGGVLGCELGYASGRAPRDAVFRTGLAAELERMGAFLGIAG